MSFHVNQSRRSFLHEGSLAGLCLAGFLKAPALRAESPPARKLCAFIKFLQEMSYSDLASSLAQMGFDGMEGTVRPGGLITPDRVSDKLPELMQVLGDHGLEMTIMASGVNRADDAVAEKTLRLAAKLGIRRYRMDYYRYDLNRPLPPQVANFRAMAKELAALNQELGLQAIYQNHAGARYLGASMWDLVSVLEGIPASDMAIGFDVRHASVEGGLSWPLLWKVAQPHLGALYVKDFLWKEGKVVNVALGQGWVSRDFFESERLNQVNGPISLHVEYLHDAGVRANAQALRQDLKTLREWIQTS